MSGIWTSSKRAAKIAWFEVLDKRHLMYNVQANRSSLTTRKSCEVKDLKMSCEVSCEVKESQCIVKFKLIISLCSVPDKERMRCSKMVGVACSI